MKLSPVMIAQICGMLIYLGIISKDKKEIYIINKMIIDLRIYKMKSESTIVSAS